MAVLSDGGFFAAVSTILGKVQDEAGSPASPTAAEGFRAFDIDVQPSAEALEMSQQVGVLGRTGSPGTGVASRILTFKSAVAGWGTSWVDQPPELDALFRCAKLAVTADGTTHTVQYDPITTGEEWTTFKVCWHEVYHVLSDAQANLKFSAAVGEPVIVEASIQALWAALADASIVAPSALHATLAPPFKSATFQIGSDTVPVASFEFDLGNVITPRPDPGPADGIGGFLITDRNLSGSFSAEMTKVATMDWETLFKEGGTSALTIVIGSGTGNTITFYFPAVQIVSLAPTLDADIRRYNVGFKARYVSGDDEFYIKFE
jgi:hypothetical protein